MPNIILAFDFGGTKLSAAVTKPGMTEWLSRRRTFTPAAADGPYEYAAMLEMAQEIIVEAGPPQAIGVSFGGPVDARQGLVHLSHHVANWENVPLRDRLQAEFGVPVFVDNDANAAALGELVYGAGQGCESLLYVTVSTGIGSGLIINGQPYRGYDGLAGEIGHVVVNPGGVLCVCGKQGCLEAEACGPAMAQRLIRLLSQFPKQSDSFWPLLDRDEETITGKAVAQAAAAGHPLAQQALTESAQFLGQGLGIALNVMNPQRIVLGGGVTKAGDLWWRTVRETARYHTLPEIMVDVVAAALGDDAPLWGAVALATMTNLVNPVEK